MYMDFGNALNFVYEFAYFLGVFVLFLLFAVFRGRQSVMNVIIGLYLALLISIQFPNYEQLFSSLSTPESLAIARLAFFIFITLFTTALCYRIMPSEFHEHTYESLWKKIALSLSATILIMIFSFQILPVSEFLTTGTPLQNLFGPEPFFFWWLLVPLVILYIV
jgi:hypothetical protein